MNKNIYKKTDSPVEISHKISFGVITTLIAIFLFGFFVPFNQSSAQEQLTPTITLTTSLGTVRPSEETTVTAKVDQFSIATLAQKSNSVTFSSSPIVQGFEGVKCDTSKEFVGQVWDCTVQFQSSTKIKTTYTISASFVLSGKTYKATPITVTVDPTKPVSTSSSTSFNIYTNNTNNNTITVGENLLITASLSSTANVIIKDNTASFSFSPTGGTLEKNTCMLKPVGFSTTNSECTNNFSSSSTAGVFEVKASILIGGKTYQSVLGVTVVCKTSQTLVNGICKDPVKIPAGNNANTTVNTNTTYEPLAPLPGMQKIIDTQKSTDNSNPCPFGNYLNTIIKIIIGFAAVLAMVMIVWGGVEYMTSDLVSSKEAGKETIMHAVLGLLIALGAFVILNTINPQLLNACLNNLPQATITISSDDTSTGSDTSLCISTTNPPSPDNAQGTSMKSIMSKPAMPEYLKTINTIGSITNGRKYLITAQAGFEGFYPNSKSYKTNNPGNIGNTDNGATKSFSTLTEGIQAQATKVVSGQGSYKIGAKIPCALGNETYDGSLYQYLRIYATGARLNNNYVNAIIGYFNDNGKNITARTKMSDIYNMN